jgi:DNA-binding transcriptional ArsR family regulator
MTQRAPKVIRRAEHLRLLADPVRLRILEALRDAPASPHALARRFGQKPTALYHHFARLEHAGIIEVVETRQRRGMVERLYQPTTSQIVVDRALATGRRSSRSVDAVLAAASTIFQVTVEDTRAAALDPSRPLGDASRSEIATLVARVSPAQAKLLMRSVRTLLARAYRSDGSGAERVRLTLAVIPLAAAVSDAPRGRQR